MGAYFQYMDLAQIIAFPIEVMGLLLVVIELFSPNKADAIENWIDGMSIRRKKRLATDPFYTDTRSRVLNALQYIGIAIVAVSASFMAFNVLSNWESQSSFMKSITVFHLALLPGWIVLITLEYYHNLIDILNRITYGKALGAIGLFLALIGFGCECYQFAGLVLGFG